MHALGPDVCLGENHWSFATWQLSSLLFYIIFTLQLIIRPLIHSLNRIQYEMSQMRSSKPFLAPWLFLSYFVSWILLCLELYICRYHSQTCKSEATTFPGFLLKPECLWRWVSMWLAVVFCQIQAIIWSRGDDLQNQSHFNASFTWSYQFFQWSWKVF